MDSTTRADVNLVKHPIPSIAAAGRFRHLPPAAGSRRRWLATCWMLVGFAFAIHPATATQIAQANRVDWILVGRQCQPPANKTVSCGNYGKFYFGSNPGLGCQIKAAGSEIPLSYNLPGFQDTTITITTTTIRRSNSLKAVGQGTGGGGGGGGGGTLPPPPVPCDDGSCLSPPGGDDGLQPWLMILDWTLEPWRDHGLMMATLGNQIFDGPVSLFGVDQPQITSLLGAAIGDAHLLSSVCQVLDQVHAGSLRPPTALSMSLGRFDQPADANATPCDKNLLSCQLAKVIKRLAARGTLPFAAAGNYKLREFPADLAHVIEVGNLDIAKYQLEQHLPTWETPLDNDYLQAGSGVCIEWTQGDTQVLYPTSPGTSFSTIITAASIAWAIDNHDVEEPLQHSWLPSWQPGAQAGSGCFAFDEFSPPLCNEVVDRIYKRMLGIELVPCWQAQIVGEVLDLPMPAQPASFDPTLGLPGLAECFSEEHLPKPTNDICIPCGMGQYKSKAVNSLQRKAVGLPIDTAIDLVVDITGASAQELGIGINGLVLRIGGLFYSLLDSNDPLELAKLARADYDTLVIRDVFPMLPEGSQPSLLTFYEATGLGQGNVTTCWHSTPISLMGRFTDSPLVP